MSQLDSLNQDSSLESLNASSWNSPIPKRIARHALQGSQELPAWANKSIVNSTPLFKKASETCLFLFNNKNKKNKILIDTQN